MTREEAIDVLKHNYPSSCYEDLCKAVDMAIKVLEQPFAQPEGIYYVKFSEEDYEKMAEQMRKTPIVLTFSEPEIIRCGECKWYLEKYGTCSCHQWDVSDGCQYAEVDCEMDFCSYAERKEQDDG